MKLARFDLFGMLFAIVAWLPASAANAAEPKPAAEPSVRQTSPPTNDNQANKAQQLLQRAKQTLSQVEGTIRLPGLKEPVEILRDRWGIPHIYANNQHDLFFAQGFVAAQDRLFQIDLWRRIAVGETAEILGRRALVRDHFARLTRYQGDMEAEWNSYAPDTREIATAFTAGINACIEQMGDNLPIEFQILKYRPARWQPEDVLGRMAVLPVALNLTREVARAELVATVGLEKARLLMPADPELDYEPADGLDLLGIDQSVLKGYGAVTQSIVFREPVGSGESNNWAVSGHRSASGKPMMASDPHRTLALPSLRYLVHLNAPGWNVIGSGEPALPGVAIGHNERIAWGFTIVGTDQADLVIEETHPEDPNRYRTPDGWKPMTIRREKTRVRGEDGKLKEVELTLRYTRNGPVLHEDRERRRAYVLRWVGSEPGTAAYLASLSVGRAQNWKEYVAAVARWKTPSENMVYADVDGNIGWVAAALTPVRSKGHGLLPVPGADDNYAWKSFLSVEQLPQTFNPKSGYVLTANHNILPPDYPHVLAYEWADGYRFQRLKSLLEGKEKFTLKDFQRMQFDQVSLPAKQMAALLTEIGPGDADLEPYAKLLAGWDGKLDRDGNAGVLWALWRGRLVDAFFGPHVPKHLMSQVTGRVGVTLMVDTLRKPNETWFGDNPAKARDVLVRSTFADAVAQAKKRLGPDPTAWKLGNLQKVLFRHPLAGLGPEFARAFNVGPLPSGSGPFAPDQARYDGGLHRLNGASYRHVLDLADWDRGMATSAPGNSGQPGSPHYDDLVRMWNNAEYFPLAYSRAKVESVTKHRLVLEPAPAGE